MMGSSVLTDAAQLAVCFNVLSANGNGMAALPGIYDARIASFWSTSNPVPKGIAKAILNMASAIYGMSMQGEYI